MLDQDWCGDLKFAIIIIGYTLRFVDHCKCFGEIILGNGCNLEMASLVLSSIMLVGVYTAPINVLSMFEFSARTCSIKVAIFVAVLIAAEQRQHIDSFYT